MAAAAMGADLVSFAGGVNDLMRPRCDLATVCDHVEDVVSRLAATEQRLADAKWARVHLLPWIGRRLTGSSSGDGLPAKRPTLAPLHVDPTACRHHGCR